MCRVNRVKTQLTLWRAARCVRPTKEARLILLSPHFLPPMFAWEEPHKYLSRFLAAPLACFKLWQKKGNGGAFCSTSLLDAKKLYFVNPVTTVTLLKASRHPVSIISAPSFPSHTPTSTPFLLLLSCAHTTCIIPSFSIIWPNACTTKISLQI